MNKNASFFNKHLPVGRELQNRCLGGGRRVHPQTSIYQPYVILFVNLLVNCNQFTDKSPFF